MQRLLAVALLGLALTACGSPTAPQPNRCDNPTNITWKPVLDAAGDTVMWFGVCGYRHQ